MSQSRISLVPYSQITGPDPLPPERTWQRLLEDGLDEAGEYVRALHQDDVHRRSIAAYRQRTLVVTWDRAPGARWAFNLPEASVSSLPRGEPSLPVEGHAWDRFRWECADDHHCRLVYENDRPRGALECEFRGDRDSLDYTLTLRIDDDGNWENMYCHGCLNHCWADGFGRDAYVQVAGRLASLREIPNPHGIWIRIVTLEDEARYAELKKEAVRLTGLGGRIRDDAVEDWTPEDKIPLQGAQGKFIATTRHGPDPLTVVVGSPHAIAVSWSFWPCTDIDLAFGDIEPGVPKSISGTVRFSEGEIDSFPS